MAALLTIAATATVISAATVTKLQAVLTATVPDPAWSATVAGPSLASCGRAGDGHGSHGAAGAELMPLLTAGKAE
jgi:hypothetical protein